MASLSDIFFHFVFCYIIATRKPSLHSHKLGFYTWNSALVQSSEKSGWQNHYRAALPLGFLNAGALLVHGVLNSGSREMGTPITTKGQGHAA